jgi:DNA repair exonuclease SbcCD ATPase subunit
VITNEDIESSAPLNPPEEKATPDGKSDGTQDTATVEDVAPAKKASKESKRLEDQEREMDKRTDEINKQYLDRIAGIREQIQKAQQNLARLQRDQLESTNNFQRNVGTFPSIPEYQQQQRVFTEQIDATRDSITTLNSQLEDAKEAARHAGVPHATDY